MSSMNNWLEEIKTIRKILNSVPIQPIWEDLMIIHIAS